jgi:hypothetical protein
MTADLLLNAERIATGFSHSMWRKCDDYLTGWVHCRCPMLSAEQVKAIVTRVREMRA